MKAIVIAITLSTLAVIALCKLADSLGDSIAH